MAKLSGEMARVDHWILLCRYSCATAIVVVIAKLHGVLDGVAAGVSADDRFHTVSVCAL